MSMYIRIYEIPNKSRITKESFIGHQSKRWDEVLAKVLQCV